MTGGHGQAYFSSFGRVPTKNISLQLVPWHSRADDNQWHNGNSFSESLFALLSFCSAHAVPSLLHSFPSFFSPFTNDLPAATIRGVDGRTTAVWSKT